MHEIKLTVSDENLDTLLVILNNLKEGLVGSMEIDAKMYSTTSRYRPKVATVVREEDSGANDKSGKYATAAIYKARLKK